jgi:hypothetical protein
VLVNYFLRKMVIFKYKIKVSFLILANLFRPFGFIAPKNYLAFLFFDLSIPDEGYSRNMLCAVPDEGYSRNMLCAVPDEGYSRNMLCAVPDEGYSRNMLCAVPDEGYSRNMLCTLNLISTFLFQMCLEIISKYLLLKERGSYSMKC